MTLTALFPELAPGELLARYWPERPCVGVGSVERLAGLIDLPELASLEALASVPWSRADAQGCDAEGKHVRTEVTSADLFAAHAAGRTIYLHDLRVRAASFASWLATIERELGARAGTIGVNLFASRRGAGTKLHFDNVEAIVVQVSGIKRWRFAPNAHVRFAPVNYVAGESINAELASLCSSALPTHLDHELTQVDVVPGTVLFLPRGCWHETETLEDSVHLDLVLRVPTWAEVLAEKIRHSLTKHEHWRAPAIAIDSDPQRDVLASLLERFNDDLSLE